MGGVGRFWERRARLWLDFFLWGEVFHSSSSEEEDGDGTAEDDSSDDNMVQVGFRAD